MSFKLDGTRSSLAPTSRRRRVARSCLVCMDLRIVRIKAGKGRKAGTLPCPACAAHTLTNDAKAERLLDKLLPRHPTRTG